MEMAKQFFTMCLRSIIHQIPIFFIVNDVSFSMNKDIDCENVTSIYTYFHNYLSQLYAITVKKLKNFIRCSFLLGLSH